VAGNDVAIFADQDRIREAEGPDATRNFRHLGGAMGASIPSKWNQAIQWPVVDLQTCWEIVHRDCALACHSTIFLVVDADGRHPPPEFRDVFAILQPLK
jgi:hypothetical protein